MKRKVLFSLLIAISFFLSCSTNKSGIPSAAAEAKKFRTEKKYDRAISVYKKHIASRLADKARPDFENPYFYYLLICDTYLEMNKAIDAEKAINTASENKVDLEFIVDRYRQIIVWYEKQKLLEKAHAMATKYRKLNPDVFDVDIDRLNKKIVETQQKATK